MDIPTIHPPSLQTGDTVAIVAPAGPIEQRDGLQRGIDALKNLGFRVQFEERIFQSNRYLAGDDVARAEELMLAFEDRSVRAIIGLRGGYGCSRLIPYLQEKRLRPYPKVFMGFSDITTLHLFFRRRFGWITIHGPMVASPSFGNMQADQQKHLISLWTDPGYRPSLQFPKLETWEHGIAEGTLIGGCLSLIVASIGTPYEIKTDGKILFLEDQGEPPYRLDRMITQLNLAGKLQSLSGILLGTFHECESTQSGYSTEDVLKEILIQLRVPILANFPAGHGAQNWAIPLGAKFRMDADAQSLELLEPAVS
jgi:muramoyltetrapeptide carboxypeptidase